MGKIGNGNGRHIARNKKMFWIAAGVTIALMGWFTLAFFRDEWNVRDVPFEIVWIGLGFVASYVAHNKVVVQNKCPNTENMPGEWILILALVWAAIIMSLYQAKAFEHLWGMDKVAVPDQFFRFLEVLGGIFGLSSVWNFFPRQKNSENNNSTINK